MTRKVKPKKHLGQHFLRNEDVALRIVDALKTEPDELIIEVGPGDGVLSKHLLERHKNIILLDVDLESIDHLKDEFPFHRDKIIFQDFLAFPVEKPSVVIGNFPYNISSQIVFKIIDDRQRVRSMVGMFQKEVAERIASGPGSKVYGISRVLTQAYYDVDYLFTVEAREFDPPPKVQSGVIRLTRKGVDLDCDEKAFKSIVKRSFNQRRKMLRKSLKDLITEEIASKIEEYLTQRPEQLSVADFVRLVNVLTPPK